MGNSSVEEITAIDRIAKFLPGERKELIRWLSKQGEAVWMEVWDRQSELVRSAANDARNKGGEAADDWKNHHNAVVHSCFLRAIYAIRHCDEVLKKKAEKSEDEIAAEAEIYRIRTAIVRAEKRQRVAPVAEKFRRNHYVLVKQMRQDGLSWREISRYLSQFHRANYAHNWLQRTFDRLQKAEAGD